MLLLLTRIVCLVILAAVLITAVVFAHDWLVGWLDRRAGRGYQPRHLIPDPGPPEDDAAGPGVGSIPFTPVEGRPPWDLSGRHFMWNTSSADNDAAAEHRIALFNGHTIGCLRPDDDHAGACPEDGDWPDDYGWPGPGGPAEPVGVDMVLAGEFPEDPAAEGWTRELLDDLHTAPTSLDGPLGAAVWSAAVDEAWEATEDAERLADTGEIQLASLRADYAADLSGQDADAAEFRSRLASTAAEIRLSISVK